MSKERMEVERRRDGTGMLGRSFMSSVSKGYITSVHVLSTGLPTLPESSSAEPGSNLIKPCIHGALSTSIDPK